MAGFAIGLYPSRMPAYAVTMRIQPARPHRVDPVRSAHDDLGAATFRRPTAIVEDVSGASLGDRLNDRWSAFRADWVETVFFVFDPESWR